MDKLSNLISRRVLQVAVPMVLSVSSPALAQETVEALLVQLLTVQTNQSATPEELEAATRVVDRIVAEFPSSQAAASILLDQDHLGIDFSSFAERLAAAPPLAETPTPALPNFLAGAGAVPETTACISEGYAPTAQAPMQMNITILADGGVQGLPQLTAPEAPSAAIRADYLGLVSATESCLPLQWGPAGEYTLSVSEAGALSVAPVIAFVTLPVAPAAPEAQTGTQQPAAGLPTFLAATPTPAPMSPSSPESEDLMALDRQAIRDIQARLLVSGYDPNGVDGVLGNGARTAYGAWQASIGAEPNGYLNAQQLAILKTQSEAQLNAWLQDPSNAATYDPPVAKAKPKAKRAKKRVRVCKRNAIGVLYNCRTVLR